MSCNIGLHKMVQSVVKDKPWFKYTFKQDRVEIVNSPKKKINKYNAYSIASKLSDALNEGIQNGPIQIGKVFYPTNINDKFFVMIAPSTEQLDKLNKNEELVIESESKNKDSLLKNEIPIPDTFSEEEIELNREDLLEDEPYATAKNFVPPANGQFTLFSDSTTRDSKDEMIKQKYFPNSNENTSTDVLQKIALSDHPLAPVAGNLLQFDPKVSIELVDAEDLGQFVDDSGEVRTASAIYSNNKIRIAKNANFKGLGSEPTLIHEIVHAMTYEYIKKNPNSEEVKALKEIYKHALTLKKDMPSDAYPFTNLDEFVVAVFTNASTIKFLLAQPSISKSEPNFLANIFKAIMNLFKLDSSNKTLFNDAFIAATNIIIAQDAANKRNSEDTFFISDDGTLFSPTSENTFFQKQSSEGIVASEKTIRDLAARMSDRIGIPFVIETDRTKSYKGKIQNGTAYINLAYASLDTPIHEILGHPLIRAIRNKATTQNNLHSTNDGRFVLIKPDKSKVFFNSLVEARQYVKNANESELYGNLLKELDYGVGKEVLDRIKKDYRNKLVYVQNLFGQYSIHEGYVLGNAKRDANGNELKFNTLEEAQAFGDTYEEDRYDLEEQQEEALVELLGMMTAEKLDNVKDGKLISLLKRLLKEMKSYIKELIGQKEIEINNLPDNMTIGDISDLLAYSNSKLILPGYSVLYTTADNKQFKTYQEASKHISDLAKNVKDVDLDNVDINNITINQVPKEGFSVYNGETNGMGNDNIKISFNDDTNKWEYTDDEFKTIKNISEKEVLEFYNKFTNSDEITNSFYTNNPINNFIEKNKNFEQAKDIIEEWKKVNGIEYNPEEVYSRGQEFISVVGAYSSFDVNLMMQNLLQHIEDNEKAGGEFAISAFTRSADKRLHHLENGGGKIRFKMFPQSKDILWAANTDVYSGSVWDASEKISKDVKSELLGVSYTKYPALANINAVQPNLASIIEDIAHAHNELGIVLTGNNFRLEYDEDIPYTTKKIIDSINSILDQKYGKVIKPEIKNALEYSKSELIDLLPDKVYTNYLKFERRSDGWYSLTAIEEFNKKEFKKIELTHYNIDNLLNQAKEIGIKLPSYKNETIPPTQTNDNLKETIDSIKNKNNYIDENQLAVEPISETEFGIFTFMGRPVKLGFATIEEANKWLAENKAKDKKYDSQALINTKIAKIKEVAKAQPRSLIRSEIVPTGQFLENETLEQKVSSGSSPLQIQGINQTEASPETVAKLTELLESLNIPVEQMDELFAQLGVNGLADGVNRLIQIAKGKESVALAEETMHMLTLMAPAEMMDTLMENITDYKIYKEVYNNYKGHPAYQNEDGSPNERMIKLEAVGKLLAEYYIMNAEGLSPEEVNIAKTIWGALKDWIKNVFGAKVDSFQDFINKVNSGKYFSENMQTRDERLLQLAFTKEDSSNMADSLVAGLTTMSSYEQAKKQFKKDARINMVPEVRAMIALENAISTFTARDLPEINNLQSFIHLPKKRAFATSKFKLKEASKEIDAIDDATYFKQFKDKAMQSLEYIRNMYTVAENLAARVTSIKESIRDNVNYDKEGHPTLDPNDRMKMHYEMEMIQSTMEIYKNELEQLASLFEDLGQGNPVSDMVKKVNAKFSNALLDTGNILKGNLRETLSKFIEPQVEQYKKLQNKQLIEFQKQLNEIDQKIAKQRAKGKSTKSLEKDKAVIEDKMDIVQENIDNPPLSVNNLMDILENTESARTNDKLSITRILEAGRTNKNQGILAITTLLSNATLDSHKAAEASQGILRTIFKKFNRSQNIKGSAFDDVVDQVVRYKFNEKTGELEEYDDRVLTRSVKQWLFEDDLEVLKYLYHRAETNAADIDEIVKEYKKYMGEDLTAAEKANLVDTFKNKHNDLVKNFGKTKYNDAYNQVQKILDDAVLSTGQTVREYRRAFVVRLTDASDIINDVMSDEVALEIALEDKADVLKELQQLESIFDYNTGQDKTGDALLVAETILRWKKAKKKVEVAPGVFESIDQYYTTYTAELKWKEDKEELENAVADAEMDYATNPTQANKDALATIKNSYNLWRKMNVSMQAPEEFYLERSQIIEGIQSIIETTKINNRAEKAFDYEYDLAWQTLISLTKGSKDDNGVIEGSGLMAASDRIKAAEEEIEKLRNTIKNFRTRMSESDYKDITELMDKLNDMQENSLTDYWDKMFLSKFNNEKAIMISNGMDSPTSAEVIDSMMQTKFFKDNTLDVTDKYSETEDADLPKDVIRYYKSLGEGRMVVKTVRPIYIWRQSLPKGQYAKQDQMSFNLKNYKVNPVFENPEHETMDGKISLNPDKVIPNGITPSRYENKKYSALKQDQIDFLDEVRAFYYADQMKKSRKDRLGDSLPRISAVKTGRRAQLLNPRNWRYKKIFSKQAISDNLFGNTTTKMETEYGEGRAKNANKRIFAKYTHGTTTHSTQEKDLFKLLAMYNAEAHRAEKLNEYIPAMNTASKIAADKKFSASLEYQINFGLNKTSKKALLGKKVDAYTDSVRSAKGFFRLGFPWQTGSVIKNTATGSFAIWSNSAKLKQYSEGMFTKAYAKALPFAVQLVAERFVETPSKKTAILRRLNVVSGYDINDAVSNNADILLKTANGLGYAMGSIRAASETHLDLTMYELYRSGNPIIVNGQAIDIEDMYDYDNGVLTPKPGLTSEMENMLTNSVEEMKSYTQGNFASNNVSLIQQNFLGRSVLFMRKHIYNPLMRRIGTKRYTATGHEIEGFYRVIGAMLKSSWTNKNMGYLTNRSNEEKIAVNAFLKDVVATTIIGAVLYFIEKAMKEADDDDEENWLSWYSLLIFRKVVSEIAFLNPVEKVAAVHHVLTTSGYNKRSGNPITSAMMYGIGKPAVELGNTMLTPIDMSQLQFKNEFESTDPYYNQFNDHVLLYDFLRTISWKNDYEYSKSSLKSYEWFNVSGFQYSGEDEFVQSGKPGRKRKSNAGL